MIETKSSSPYDRHRDEYQHVWERVWKSMHTLATGLGSIQNRLGFVWLDLSPLKREEFPEAVRPAFNGIMDDLRARYVDEPDGQCWIDIPDDDARELAKRVVNLYCSIDSLRIVGNRLS